MKFCLVFLSCIALLSLLQASKIYGNGGANGLIQNGQIVSDYKNKESELQNYGFLWDDETRRYDEIWKNVKVYHGWVQRADRPNYGPILLGSTQLKGQLILGLEDDIQSLNTKNNAKDLLDEIVKKNGDTFSVCSTNKREFFDELIVYNNENENFAFLSYKIVTKCNLVSKNTQAYVEFLVDVDDATTSIFRILEGTEENPRKFKQFASVKRSVTATNTNSQNSTTISTGNGNVTHALSNVTFVGNNSIYSNGTTNYTVNWAEINEFLGMAMVWGILTLTGIILASCCVIILCIVGCVQLCKKRETA
jgi:hypothetical protein